MLNSERMMDFFETLYKKHSINSVGSLVHVSDMWVYFFLCVKIFVRTAGRWDEDAPVGLVVQFI